MGKKSAPKAKPIQPGTERKVLTCGPVETYREATYVLTVIREMPEFVSAEIEGADPYFQIAVQADVTDERNEGVVIGRIQGIIDMVEWTPPHDPNPEIPMTRETKSVKALYRKRMHPRKKPRIKPRRSRSKKPRKTSKKSS